MGVIERVKGQADDPYDKHCDEDRAEAAQSNEDAEVFLRADEDYDEVKEHGRVCCAERRENRFDSRRGRLLATQENPPVQGHADWIQQLS